ncbi:MAG: hypothetical protein E7071_02105 [Bacteroidales bacterium]|nr:hypothetical protein [Bacteroidales bacterium]
MARRYYNREEPKKEKRERVDYIGMAKGVCSSLMPYITAFFSAVWRLVKSCFATKRRCYIAMGVVAFLVLTIVVSRCDFETSPENEFVEQIATKSKVAERLKPYFGDFQSNRQINRAFNDLNDKHIVAAKANGIPATTVKGTIDEIVDKYDLELIESCRLYEVDKLTHSAPYLVPKAADLLKDICKNFRDSVENKGYPEVKPIITSVFRTPESVKKLQRSGNVNSSANSAHLYATTVDITYRRFEGTDLVNADIYKYIMAEVLRDLRKEGRCYVKFELKQACYHITVR